MIPQAPGYTGHKHIAHEEYRQRIADNKDKLLQLAEELHDIEREITFYGPITPSSVEFGTAIVRARWAILGLVTEGG